MTSEMKHQQLEWRGQKILKSLSKGYCRSEICQKLQLDRVTVHRDIVFLRQQAQENLRHYIQETISELSQQCMTGMNRNLKQTL